MTGVSFANRFVLPSPLRFRSDGGLYLSRRPCGCVSNPSALLRQYIVRSAFARFSVRLMNLPPRVAAKIKAKCHQLCLTRLEIS
jgi:hypothetical protein